ncbi:hypothetical protein JCGZ_05801 [Jatropha curcas]|uniref:Uncharacterized protein n=1 Tax=Jatropha curcas TaxID=180498 RepID=A0A067KQ85_JATCU|nr:hypothetical protein JCGZ_05801 [Jatropha curcas]
MWLLKIERSSHHLALFSVKSPFSALVERGQSPNRLERARLVCCVDWKQTKRERRVTPSTGKVLEPLDCDVIDEKPVEALSRRLPRQDRGSATCYVHQKGELKERRETAE